MNKRMLSSALVTCSLISSMALATAQPGMASATFNRKFANKLTLGMSLEKVEQLAGSPGHKFQEDKGAAGATASYHWDGKKGSALDANVAAGKLTGVTIHTPKKRRMSITKSGDVVELD